MKTYFKAVIASFIVIFNLGYVFHDVLLGEWLHRELSAVARESYIIPIIGLSYFAYVLITAYLLPIYHKHAGEKYGWSILKSGLIFGLLMGFFWDALQGGLIEYATQNLTLASTIVDSTYHTLEGGLNGSILAWVYKKSKT